MTTDNPNQDAGSSEIDKKKSDLDFSRLTHQNWLFINAFLSFGNIKKAYQLAKYTGTEQSAPYQVFKRLKPFIEQIGDLDVTSRARLQADVKSVLDIPLEERESLTLKEWLEVRKFTAKLTPEATQAKPQISVLIINRPAKVDKGTVDSGNSITPPSDSPEIIQAEVIPNQEAQ